ncbi:AMP-binding protein [Alphaproteobacteria bacterium]|nr:AMP-binding protein [Alphaproteobacteria bacterium]
MNASFPTSPETALSASSIESVLQKHADIAPDDIWLTSPEIATQFTWQDSLQRARDVACHIQGAGIAPGESVAIAAPNGVAACYAFLGVVFGGFRATPLNLVAGKNTLRFVLEHSKSRLILCADDSKHLISDVVSELENPPLIISMDTNDSPRWSDTGITPVNPAELSRPDANSIALLMYTSGTTGVPKGVLLSHGNLLAAGTNVQHAHKLNTTDTGLCILPIYHINGLSVTVMGTLISQSQLIMPHRFSASQFWGLMHAHDCSWFSGVPTQFSYLLNDRSTPTLNKARLRFARSASAPLSPTVQKDFENRFGIPIIETMGLTETGAQILSNPLPPATRKIGSPGIAFGNEVAIWDANNTPLPANVQGEIMIRGDNVMQGYLDRPEETEKTLTHDGWLHTGDLGHMDEDGYIFVTGRIKELIIKGGENIAPREIDEALMAHEAVLEAAAFPVNCDDYGQRVEACVTLKSGMSETAENLRIFCTKQVGAFKTPDKIHFMDELPKGPSGKVQRLKLIELLT